MSQLVQLRWDAKLTNWALWIVSRDQGDAAVSAPDREWWNHPPRPPQPLIGEAKDVDDLVQIIAQDNPDQYLAVRAWYVWSGTREDRALTLGVPYNTWRDRVVAARYRLDELAILRRALTVAPPRQVLAFG
jgi:hypothetical protein